MTTQKLKLLISAACIGLLATAACAVEVMASQSKLIVTPQRLEGDTLQILNPVKTSRRWSVIQPALEKMGYDVAHDRVDRAGTYTVTVGWDKSHETFRSYKTDVKGGIIASIKADYSYPAL